MNLEDQRSLFNMKGVYFKSICLKNLFLVVNLSFDPPLFLDSMFLDSTSHVFLKEIYNTVDFKYIQRRTR